MKDRFSDFYPYYQETRLFSRNHPSLYMYVSFLGNIMYIKRNRFGDFEIHTRNWRPRACSPEQKKMPHLDDCIFAGSWSDCLHRYYQLWSTEFRILSHNVLWDYFSYGFRQPELDLK